MSFKQTNIIYIYIYAYIYIYLQYICTYLLSKSRILVKVFSTSFSCQALVEWQRPRRPFWASINHAQQGFLSFFHSTKRWAMEEFGSTFHWPVTFYSCISRINSVQVELGGHKTLDGCSKLSGDPWNQVDMILLREKCAVCSDTQLTVFNVVAKYNYFLSCFNLMCDTSLFLLLEHNISQLSFALFPSAISP